MPVVYLSFFYHDPDNPSQVALLQIDSAAFADGSMGSTLYEKLSGADVSEGIFKDCVRKGHGSWFSGNNDSVVHLYLYDLSQSRDDLKDIVKNELANYLEAGAGLVDKSALIDRYNVAWLIVEMAADKAHLGSDSFEGL